MSCYIRGARYNCLYRDGDIMKVIYLDNLKLLQIYKGMFINTFAILTNPDMLNQKELARKLIDRFYGKNNSLTFSVISTDIMTLRIVRDI